MIKQNILPIAGWVWARSIHLSVTPVISYLQQRNRRLITNWKNGQQPVDLLIKTLIHYRLLKGATDLENLWKTKGVLGITVSHWLPTPTVQACTRNEPMNSLIE